MYLVKNKKSNETVGAETFVYKKQLLVVVEGDALRRLYASHHGGFTVAVAMTSSEEKKDYPPKMPLCIPQLHRASFALGSIPDIIEILLCCLGKIRLRLCTAHDYAISCHS